MRYAALVFLGACSYGVLSTFVKLSYRAGFHVQEVVGSQVFFGFLMMACIGWLVPKAGTSWKERLQLMAVGSTIGLTGMLYYGALQVIDASLAIILLFQFTWIGTLLEAILLKKRPANKQLIALSLLFIGTILAGGGLHSGLHRLSPVGLLLGFGAAASYSCFIIFSGRTANRLHPISRSVTMSFGSLILVFIIFPPIFLWNGSLLHGLSLWGFLLALFGIVIPTLLFTIGVPHVGGGLASILSSAELPMAVFMSVTVLREHVTVLQWIGVITILFGIVSPELLKVLRFHHIHDRESG